MRRPSYGIPTRTIHCRTGGEPINVLMISGSRNPEGQTARAADAILTGVEKAGGKVGRFFLPSSRIERCRQCENDGWGMCRREGRAAMGRRSAATSSSRHT